MDTTFCPLFWDAALGHKRIQVASKRDTMLRQEYKSADTLREQG